MAFLKPMSLRPLLRIAKALEQIASALTYFATNDAVANNRFYDPSALKRPFDPVDGSELMSTDPATAAQIKAQSTDLFRHSGLSRVFETEEQPLELE